MRKFMLVGTVISSVSVLACSSDEGETQREDCTSCESYEFQGRTFPAVDVCKGKNSSSVVGEWIYLLIMMLM
ncbi:hypothetical protein Q4566_05890 [Tamlana sp. 2_MG-2023]|uniref:hypothetical protein n=1 Tax=unclassified Tamlana TaxID=2614803 RepID=UPI0026E3B39E|nr:MULTISPECIES: hypothetical protein [unclassified Tamlana]MDO6759725.1 hypothetical protein [Tamlana sp. 2_MG-2023]MDO6791348.1 hypothetical protein [Tamlana sp. 1_MG-2023]